jgi:membrane protein
MTGGVQAPWAATAQTVGAAIWSKYRSDELVLRAKGLTYTTILSTVPLLAVAFSVLKAFGVHNQIEPLLARALAPLGAGADVIGQRVMEFVNNLRVGVLGGLGVAGLFYTAVSLIGAIEQSLNRIWGARRGRPLARKFRDYLSVIIVGPVLVFTALGLTASAQSHTLVQRALALAPLLTAVATHVLPYVLFTAAFTWLYAFVPSTRVTLRAAFAGGLAAGVGWQLAGSAFAAFVASAARYTAVYSGFAVLILFLVWLYVSWLIVLLGGEIAYFCQYPYLASLTAGGDAPAERERRALAALALVTERHLRGAPPWRVAEIGAALRVPVGVLEELTDLLVARGVLLRAAVPAGIALARAPEQVPVAEILDALRGAAGDASSAPADALRRAREGAYAALHGVTLRSLVTEAAPIAPPVPTL